MARDEGKERVDKVKFKRALKRVLNFTFEEDVGRAHEQRRGPRTTRVWVVSRG